MTTEADCVDAQGTRHPPAGPKARILSLVPSLTELLFDLGLGANVVGRTAFCVHPKPQIKSVPSVGGTKAVNMEKVRAVAASHVLVNIDETPQPLANDLAALGMTVVVTHPIDVTDNLGLYRLMGCLFDRRAEAETLCQQFRYAYAEAQHAIANHSSQRVLYLIWKEPWMTVARDTYISRMLASAALITYPKAADRRYPVIDLTESLLTEVDQVLFATEPFPFQEKHLQEFAKQFPAHADKARLIDAELVSWYGSRAIAGLSYLTRFVTAERENP